jgi:hypothetical protein
MHHDGGGGSAIIIITPSRLIFTPLLDAGDHMHGHGSSQNNDKTF